ncbi:MAG: phage portal protein, partial [bacterium]
MASIFDRLLRRPERRAAQPTIPTRHPAVVNPTPALSLTAVYRAVQIIGTPISKMTINTYRFATGIELKVENPVLVNNPSIQQNRRDFLFQTVASLALEGNAYWLKNFGSNGQVNNLTILPASAVQPSWPKFRDGTTDYSTVVYDYLGTRYTEREMEHLRIFSQAGQILGVS